ncbi:MAG: NAD(P)/FAD-dependent oxidoreductase, partial [Actinomycetota bacterium]
MSAVDVDLLIVGAGPVGLYGAFYAGVRGLSVAVVDSLSQVGGQVSALYPEKQILDVAGFPSVTGRALISNLVEQAAAYDPLYLLGQEAQRLERTAVDDGPDLLRVTTSTGTEVTCRAVVVTGGIGTFTPRPLPAGEHLLGRGLEYFVPSATTYVDCDVVIVGGGDSAVDWALMLHPVASSVTLVHRRETFRAHHGSLQALRATGVRVVTNAQVTQTLGDEALEAVVVSVKGEQPQTVVCQRLVAALGFTANLGPLREWGLELHDNRHLVVDSAMRTNVPGVFAAGDVNDYEGKVRLIAVGFGEVATAVNNAAVHLDPAAQL